MMDTSTLDYIDDLWQKHVNPSPKPEVTFICAQLQWDIHVK